MTLFASQAARACTLLQGYTDLASWQAAVTQLGVDDLESAPGLGNSTIYSNTTGYNDALGIDFVGAFDPSGNFLKLVNSSLSQYFNYGSGNSLLSGAATGSSQPYITVKLPANVTAIALDVMSYSNTWPVTLTASDGTTVSVPTTSGQRSFYGFTFDAPITSLKVSIPSAPLFTCVLLDNVRIGTVAGQSGVADVPEPASMLLIGLGLMFLACLNKFRPA